MASKPKTHWEREAERRREKLEHMEQQIEAGTLTVRQMTPAAAVSTAAVSSGGAAGDADDACAPPARPRP